jgi:hypothetical protein
MANYDENPRGLRAQWASAPPARKLFTVLVVLATVAIVVFLVVPLIRSIFNAGQTAVH